MKSRNSYWEKYYYPENEPINDKEMAGENRLNTHSYRVNGPKNRSNNLLVTQRIAGNMRKAFTKKKKKTLKFEDSG